MTFSSEMFKIRQEPLTLPLGGLAIETHQLSKRFGSRQAVDGLTMSVPRGTITGFVGPNGAGKTTTIRMLLGLIRPSAGRSTVLGQEIAHPRAYLPYVGALIDSPAFYPGLSGSKNLEVLAHLGGHALSRVGHVLEIVGLSDRAKDRVETYSLGMKQRLGLAMALLPDPDLLILDEPTNGLDPLGVMQVRDLLRSLHTQGKTILISSHLLGELEQVCDWLAILKEGKVVFNGSTRELIDRARSIVVEAVEATQLDLAAKIATAAGYAVRRENGFLSIACPPSFVEELKRQASEAGAIHLAVRAREASLEESFLTLVKGEHA